MARPAILQRLRHGKFLSRGVFPLFVDTWNWLIGAVDSLRGDYDVNPKNGHIKVDRSDPDHPVIRLMMPQTVGSGGGSGYTGSIIGAPELKWNTDGSYKLELWGKSMTFENGCLTSVGESQKVGDVETVGYEIT